MMLRKYEPGDFDEIIELFCDTVHLVNIKDYTEEQCKAWTSNIDFDKWRDTLSKHYTVVAVEENQIIGFADMDSSGYLDRIYVHHAWQRKGVASSLLKNLKEYYPGRMTTHASITAKPFFEKKGFHVVKKQQVKRCGILLINYVMESVSE